MKLDWDDTKRNWTLTERGLDFADVVYFDWNTAIAAQDVRADYGEARMVAYGFIGKTFFALAYTMRGQTLRVISLRRANSRERKIYDRAKTID